LLFLFALLSESDCFGYVFVFMGSNGSRKLIDS